MRLNRMASLHLAAAILSFTLLGLLRWLWRFLLFLFILHVKLLVVIVVVHLRCLSRHLLRRNIVFLFFFLVLLIEVIIVAVHSSSLWRYLWRRLRYDLGAGGFRWRRGFL